MNNYPQLIIARKGSVFLSIAVGVALFIALSSTVWSIPFWIFAVFALQYFSGKFASADRDKVFAIETILAEL